MSKRKNRTNSPNLPQETLDRARKQLGIEPVPEPEPVEKPVEPESVLEVRTSAPSTASPARPRSTRRRTETLQTRGGRKEVMTMDTVKDRLEHPTRMVTEDELRQEYGFVVKDLRSMFLLAAVLVVVMIVIAQFALF